MQRVCEPIQNQRDQPVGWSRQGSTNSYCYLFVWNVTFYDAKSNCHMARQQDSQRDPAYGAFAPFVSHSAKVRLALLAQDDT